MNIKYHSVVLFVKNIDLAEGFYNSLLSLEIKRDMSKIDNKGKGIRKGPFRSGQAGRKGGLGSLWLPPNRQAGFFHSIKWNRRSQELGFEAFLEERPFHVVALLREPPSSGLPVIGIFLRRFFSESPLRF